MSIKVSGGGGGGGGKAGQELAYVAITSNVNLAEAGFTAIPGLSVDVTVPVGTKYCIEFFSAQVSEDNNSVLGDQVSVAIQTQFGHLQAAGFTTVGANYWGSSLFVRSGTIVSDGTPLTLTAYVTNFSDDTKGASFTADPTTPTYIRVSALS